MKNLDSSAEFKERLKKRDKSDSWPVPALAEMVGLRLGYDDPNGSRARNSLIVKWKQFARTTRLEYSFCTSRADEDIETFGFVAGFVVQRLGVKQANPANRRMPVELEAGRIAQFG